MRKILMCLLFVLAADLPGCDGGDSGYMPCIEGASVACACVGGGSGAQVCQGGRLSPCVCATSDSDALAGADVDAKAAEVDPPSDVVVVADGTEDVADAATAETDSLLLDADLPTDVPQDVGSDSAVSASDGEAKDIAPDVVLADAVDAAGDAGPALTDAIVGSDTSAMDVGQQDADAATDAIQPGSYDKLPVGAPCLMDANCADSLCINEICTVAPSCSNSLDCKPSICDPALKKCVQCATSADCGGQACWNHVCKALPVACKSDLVCLSMNFLCVSGSCAQCAGDSDCGSGKRCAPVGVNGTGKCVTDNCTPDEPNCTGTTLALCAHNGTSGGYQVAVNCTGESNCNSVKGLTTCIPNTCQGSLSACASGQPICFEKSCISPGPGPTSGSCTTNADCQGNQANAFALQCDVATGLCYDTKGRCDDKVAFCKAHKGSSCLKSQAAGGAGIGQCSCPLPGTGGGKAGSALGKIGIKAECASMAFLLPGLAFCNCNVDPNSGNCKDLLGLSSCCETTPSGSTVFETSLLCGSGPDSQLEVSSPACFGGIACSPAPFCAYVAAGNAGNPPSGICGTTTAP